MPEPYVGEIRMFAGKFAPAGWMFCNGATVPISEYDMLFALIGTTYGGDGVTSFNLPNLASRAPIHMGTGPDGTSYPIGDMVGEEQVTLTMPQMPTHTHALIATTNPATDESPANDVLAASKIANMYIQDSPDGALYGPTVGMSGGMQPHQNMQPFLAINFIISLAGIFPSKD